MALRGTLLCAAGSIVCHLCRLSRASVAQAVRLRLCSHHRALCASGALWHLPPLIGEGGGVLKHHSSEDASCCRSSHWAISSARQPTARLPIFIGRGNSPSSIILYIELHVRPRRSSNCERRIRCGIVMFILVLFRLIKRLESIEQLVLCKQRFLYKNLRIVCFKDFNNVIFW